MEAGLSYLYQPAFAMDYVLRLPAEPYCPQPGDIFLATGREMWAKFGHWAVFSGAPQHAGIVFAWPDGRLALLEAGPHNTLRCRAEELIPQLDSYACVERVWIRRRRVPLTSEQSAALTAFCMSKEGARFAVLRMFGQLTPFRSRGPLRTYFLGCSHDDQFGYFCAELTMQACVAAGLIDPTTARPAATYPRDIFFGRSRNPFLDKHLCLCDWDPPARWTRCPGTEAMFSRHFPQMDGDNEDR
jgi:hypothetical protein